MTNKTRERERKRGKEEEKTDCKRGKVAKEKIRRITRIGIKVVVVGSKRG